MLLLGTGTYLNLTLAGPSLVSMAVNIAIALALTLPGYIKGVVGGGDVKLMLALAPLFSPFQLLFVFSTGVASLLLLMTFLHSVAKMPLIKAYYPNVATQETVFQRGIPLGTAIALGLVPLGLVIGF
jgi:prepilin peptidase CpaA